MQKIINLDLKNIKRHLTGGEKIIILSFASLIAGFFVFSLVFSNPTFASESITTNVLIEPSLTVTIPSTPLVLNLDPSSTTSGSNNLTITVGTNNATGYKMTMSTTSDNTNLVHTKDSTIVIPTLDTGTSFANLSDFPANKWGYKKDSGDFIPFTSPTTILESDTYANDDTTTLTFATKIDYLQESGTYNTTFQFNTVANPLVDYIQDFTAAMCQEKASSADYTVVDKRDDNDYTVRYINGNCWMTQNLRYQGDMVGSTSTATSWVMKSATSNISTDTTMTMTDLTAGDSYTDARYHVATSGQVPSGASYTAEDMGVWYNYAAASAMTITGSSNTNAQVYDICPKGWRLPTNSEQSGITSYASTYSPVAGGRYYNGTLNDAGNGYWWSSTSNSTTFRYYLYWNGSSLNTDGNNRGRGLYVRCVLNDSRTISDITTMQEMSPQIAAKMNNGDTATLKDSRDGQDYTIAKINGNVWMTRNLAIGCNGTGSTYGSDYSVKTLTSTDSNISVDYTTSTISLTAGNSNDSAYQTCSPTYGAWYNYYATTAGTINGSSIKATYDICPIGWRLPTRTEQTSITSYANAYAPISGGRYYNGSLGTNGGYWWSSDNSSADRYALYWVSSSLTTNTIYSTSGIYIRCIAK